jgi:hypothetical protein
VSAYAVIKSSEPGDRSTRVYGNRNHLVDDLKVGDKTPGGIVLWTGDDLAEARLACRRLVTDRPLSLLHGDAP